MDYANAIESARVLVLLVALGVAVFFDLRHGRVPDWCTWPAVVLGLLLAYVQGALEPAQGTGLLGVLGRPLIESILGLALALGVFGLAHLFGMLGGGDVKLMCAVGAVKGVWFFFSAAILTTCAGAIIALGVLIWRGRLAEGLKSSAMALLAPTRFKRRRKDLPPDAPELVTIPYATAIAVGTICAWVFLPGI